MSTSLFTLALASLLLATVSYARSSHRVVGGYEVDISEVPYQVSLTEGVGHYCGASIISSRWILTAAHCVYFFDNDDRAARVGSTRHGEGGQLVHIVRSVQHPQWNHMTIDFDFALMELAEELKFGKSLQAVELPEQDEVVEDGTCLQISGWGDTKNASQPSDVLRAAKVPAYNREKCAKAYADVEEITDRMMCAGYDKGGKDTCQGDSGGPLVQGNKQVGVVSWGKGCALEGYPGVYARVAAVRDWIRQTAGV